VGSIDLISIIAEASLFGRNYWNLQTLSRDSGSQQHDVDDVEHA
jgi:hypothetical protein